MSGGNDGADNSAPNSAKSGFSETSSSQESKPQYYQSEDFQFKADSEMGSIATKAELDSRIDNRPTPEPELHLTPDNGSQSVVDEQVNNDNEKRIQRLRNSLNIAQERLENGHAFAQIRGRAQHDFDQTD